MAGEPLETLKPLTATLRGLLRGAPALLLAAGCFSEPPYEPETGVVFAPSSAGSAAGGGTVTGRSPGSPFALHFADGPGFHFPDSLKIASTEVLGHEDNPGCFREDQLGVLIAPVARVSASSGTSVTRNVLTPVLPGPAVTQVKLEWEAAFTCDPRRTPKGASTFTVFPDGKIVRIDTVEDPSTSTITPSQCACADAMGSDALFHSFTYWTLARGALESFFVPDYSSDAQTLPLSGEVVFGNQTLACAQGPAAQVAFLWNDFLNAQIRGGGTIVGFSHELGEVGPSELGAFSFKDRSTAFLETKGCTAAIDRAQRHRTPSKLDIDGDLVPPSELDGIYGGDAGNGQPPGIPAKGDRVVVSGPLQGGFAVWVRFSRSVEGIRTTPSFSRPEGEWYLPQRVDDTSWILWFKDTLTGDQKITIEAR
jgi:hypothetical protein